MPDLALHPLALHGLYRVERTDLRDPRGTFGRLFCADTLRAAGWIKPVAQINLSRTARRATVRGLHFQRAPYREMKLVSCLRGAIWDVAVDLRAASPSFGRWHAEMLTADNGAALLIPEGFAHGFQACSDDVEVLYCHSAGHAPNSEGGIHPTDPHLGISWPLPIGELSARDAGLPAFEVAMTEEQS